MRAMRSYNPNQKQGDLWNTENAFVEKEKKVHGYAVSTKIDQTFWHSVNISSTLDFIFVYSATGWPYISI